MHADMTEWPTGPIRRHGAGEMELKCSAPSVLQAPLYEVAQKSGCPGRLILLVPDFLSFFFFPERLHERRTLLDGGVLDLSV